MIMRRGLILMEEFIRDLLVTEYASSVPQRKVFRATVLSGMITMANVVLITVALQDSVSGGVANIMALRVEAVLARSPR